MRDSPVWKLKAILDLPSLTLNLKTMIKLLNNFTNFSRSIIKGLVPKFAGMLRVKAGRPLVNHLLKMVLLVKGSITNSLVKVTISYIRKLYILRKRSGIAFTVLYLKASVSLLMQALSGEPHGSTRPLKVAVSRTNRGLPRIIPAIHRAHIKRGNLFYIRFWLTMLSIYRVLDYFGKLNLNSIITPSNARVNPSEVMEAMKTFRLGSIFSYEFMEVEPFWIASSSPTSLKTIRDEDGNIVQGSTYSTSIYSIMKTIKAYAEDKPLMLAFKEFMFASRLSGMLMTCVSFSRFARRYFPSKMSTAFADIHFTWEDPKYPSFLGKLAFKPEPAGKIRVFAMVDCFTQWVLRPFHRKLFEFLKTLQTDATFNQTTTLKRFVKSLKDREIRKVYSFDLTAATDRMPILAQEVILSYLFGKYSGSTWRTLLTSRWYQIPFPSWDPMAISLGRLKLDSANPFIKTHKVSWNGRKVECVEAVKYAAGQPMGALSSWAMLAVTHHVMVRIAALRVGCSHFEDYLVLGDDLVIAHEAVANEYLKLAKEWDVEINLSKSVISRNGSLEFAKRFVYKYQDVSGLSFKEAAVAYWDIRGLLQIMERISAFRNIRVSEVLNFLGHGYRTLSRFTADYKKLGLRLRRVLLLLSYPGLIFSTLKTPEEWLTSSAFNRQMKVFDLEKSINILKDFLYSVVDSVKQGTLPRTPDEFKILYHSMYGLTDRSKGLRNSNLKFPYKEGLEEEDMANTYTFVPLRETLMQVVEPMYRDIHEQWETSIIEVKDTFDLEEEDLSIDELWSRLEQLEDIASLTSNATEFRVEKKVTTLGSSVLLRRADKIRATISLL